MRIAIANILMILGILFAPSPSAGQTASGVRLHGKVTDADTKEAIPFATIRISGSKETHYSDKKGHYSINLQELRDTLIASCTGYEDERIALSPKTRIPLNISLKPTEFQLQAVTIKPKKEKYSKKDNPAVELIRAIIRRRDDNSPKRKEYYSRDRHEKLNIAINNFNPENKNHFGKQFAFLEEYMDTSLTSGEPILHISARELIATDYYSNEPERERQHVKGRKRNGIDDMFSTGEIEALYEEAFKDVDIFSDNISLFGSKFVSPLSKLGPTFYKYYILDSMEIGGERCLDLAFTPFNVESFGFSGHIFVTADSTFFIKSVQMSIPRDINMNFVDRMDIRQEFSRTPDGTRILDRESLTAELKLFSSIYGFYAHREVAYNNYSFESNEIGRRILESPARVVEDDNSTNKSDEFWSANRISTMTEKEMSVARMMQELRNNPVYYWLEKGVSFLFTGWVPIRKHEPPLFYGPVNTSVSHNDLEGWRLRTGAMTSAHLYPNLFGNFYVAYGLGDHRWKYMGEVEYSFKKKKEHPNEFPIHSLRARYESDIFQYGQNYLYTNKDNIFLSLKREKDNKIGYMKNAELTYTREFYNNFSYYITLRNRKDIASRLIPFERTSTTEGATTSTFVNDINRSEIEIGLRYAPKEKFIQSKWNRHSILPEHPVFTLTHKVGVKGILGSDINYQHTEASFRKRFWFSAFGYTDCVIKAGKVWNKVPFPLLIMPNANLSYTLQNESYSLMNAMEFFNDEYTSWDLTYYMNGLIFNRIPLIKKLSLREVITFRGMVGSLSEKNRPDPLNTGELFLFPNNNGEVHYMTSTPYMEAAFGIENIFKVLRVDYVRRLTYTNYPGVSKWGIRIRFHIQF